MCSKRLTVIIPCYNTASLLPRCLSSVKPLLNAGAEIILIDDCSTDGTSAVIRDFASGHNDVTAIYNDHNLGLPSNRSIGIRRARGRYVMMADSDDFIEPSAVIEALEIAEREDADCLIAPIVTVRDGVSRTVYPGDALRPETLTVHYSNFSECNKLLRRDFLIENDLWPFEGLNRWEDVGLTSRIFALRPRIAIADKPWYHYVIESSRPTLSAYSKSATISERCEVVRRVQAWLSERGLADSVAGMIDALKFYAKANYLRPPGIDIMAWRNTFPEINRRIMRLSQVPLYMRLITALLALS